MQSDLDSPPRLNVPPLVQAIVITHHPGDWISQTIESLAAQDYPNVRLSVSVQPGDSTTAAAISASSGRWKVLEAAGGAGWGEQVNLAAKIGDADLLLVMRDDVALQPGALSALVREYLKREAAAAVVGPKLVDWNDPSILMPSGFEADRFGATSTLVRAGDRDQGQHDRAESVFGLSPSCLLLSRTVLEGIGGFDTAIDYFGEGYDLAARVRYAGGHFVLVPAAVARHRGDFVSRVGISETLRGRRHQLRALLTSSPGRELVVSLLGLFVLNIVEFVLALVRLDRETLEIPRAWIWNLLRISTVRNRRRQLAQFAPDIAATRDQVSLARYRGSLRLAESFDRRITERETASERGEETISVVRAAGAAAISAIVLFGARHLLTREIPAIGEFRHVPSEVGTLTAAWWSAWRTGGMGYDGFAPLAYPLLDVIGLATLGSDGLLRAVLIIAPLPLGVLGAWRLFSGSASRSASVVAAALYAASPVPYNAYAGGSWLALLLYGATPWLLGSLIAAMGGQRGFGIHRRRGTATIALAVVAAVLAAFTPMAFVTIVLLVAGITVGSLLGGDFRRIGRLIAAAVVALLVAAALNAPALVDTTAWNDVLSSASTEATAIELLDLISFRTGNIGTLVTGAALLVLGLLPVLVGRGAVFSWSMRSWGIALCTWGLAWTGARGWLPFGMPVLESVLVPAALALAVLGGLAAQVLEGDGSRREARQALLSIATIGACAIALLPLVEGATSGRWELARADLATSFSAVEALEEEGGYRVLWIGDAHVLAAASIQTSNGLAWHTSMDGVGEIDALWGLRNASSTSALGDAVAAGLEGRTSRLGRELSAFGVRYIVVVDQQAPVPEPSRRVAVADNEAATLSAQLDLVRTGVVNPAVVVYENTAWAPLHSGVAAIDISPLRLDDTAPVLTNRNGPDRWEGQTRAARSVYSALEPSDRWTLQVDGTSILGSLAGGVGLTFATEDAIDPTNVSLTYATPTSHRVLVVLQGLGLAALVIARRWAHGRERRGRRRVETVLERAL